MNERQDLDFDFFWVTVQTYPNAEVCVMEKKYLFETFSSESMTFDTDFTDFLNGKEQESWEVQDCSYCNDTLGSRMYDSCLFKRAS
ncbi:MAG: hypothetical protein JSU72_16105 [Deltaproteobacteria bacterium]|nr:MAG: hypothetical protein JSU72_16105 [Deltaproteobacteria bacterium]